ncbi:MAG TPA: T9SS type A sorting domain-containing protein [Bacteroidia bacterium]|nr:T9SS type A sorting domain-containing protein [Bacteroidia bacterium]HNS11689.1 T9SS type A sorting domain-containing protein [Bacteroidia bacterium]
MKRYILLIIVTLKVVTLQAQLNGHYTIGGSTPDFATFTDAVDMLNSIGVSGPVTFNVRNGVYFERLTIPEITGASALNQITFQSENLDSSLVTLQYAADSSTGTTNFIIRLDGADWITIKSITIKKIGSGIYSRLVLIENSATNNSFLNNHFETLPIATLSTNSVGIYSGANASFDSSTGIIQNRFVNGSFGIRLHGIDSLNPEQGQIIENNYFENISTRAIYLINQNAPRIRNNKIETLSSSANFYGISLGYCSNNTIVEANSINTLAGGNGIYASDCYGTALNPMNIINNFIHVGGTSTAYGLYLLSSTGINIWNNSVHVSSTDAISRAMYVLLIGNPGLNIQNNILANSGGGTAIHISISAIASLISCNYNDLYSNGPNIGYWDNAFTPTFADWKSISSRDSNSVSVNPDFISSSDLHTFSASVDGRANPLGAVSTDIDGEPRDLVNPDIGADEFTLLNTNISLTDILSPAPFVSCGQASNSIEISVNNVGSTVLSSIPVVAEISGVVNLMFFDTIPGPISPGLGNTFTFNQTFSSLVGGQYFIKVYSSLANDQFRQNDTLYLSSLFETIPNDPVAVSPQQGCNTSVGITANAASGEIIYWYDAAVGGNLVGIGSPLTVPIVSDTIFYAEAHAPINQFECLKIVEYDPVHPNGIEIQNLSTQAFDASGWKVAVSSSSSLINNVNTSIWTLGYFNPGEIQYKTDLNIDNYWGNDIRIEPGDSGWIMLLDSNYVLKDFIAFEWTAAQIQSMAPVINGVSVHVGSMWSGDGLRLSTLDTTISRIGNYDHNNSSDFAYALRSIGFQNTGLSTSYLTCGYGSCGSNRIAISVQQITGVITDLGPDTIFSAPFTYILDAGSGFAGYLWSDGSTSQTLTVNSAGLYWVRVTGSNGCSFTDSIDISINTGTKLLSKNSSLKAFPNPTGNVLTIQCNEKINQIHIYDLNGRLIKSYEGFYRNEVDHFQIDVSAIPPGIYLFRALIDESIQSIRLVVQH